MTTTDVLIMVVMVFHRTKVGALPDYSLLCSYLACLVPSFASISGANSKSSVPHRLMIFIIIGIYLLVGVQISRRRHAFEAIEKDFIPLDDTTASTTALQDADESNVELRSQFRYENTAHPGIESLETMTLQPSTVPHNLNAMHSRTGSFYKGLSFRQYILMPLFFSLALLSVWIVPSINRIGSFIKPGFSSYPLLLCVGATGSLRGFWNGVIFVTIGLKTRERR